MFGDLGIMKDYQLEEMLQKVSKGQLAVEEILESSLKLTKIKDSTKDGFASL